MDFDIVVSIAAADFACRVDSLRIFGHKFGHALNSPLLVKLLKSHFLDCLVYETQRKKRKHISGVSSTAELTKLIRFFRRDPHEAEDESTTD